MPTETLNPVYSFARGQRTVNSPTSISVIEAFHGLLPAVGWDADGLFATATILYPFGLAPTVSGPEIPDKTVACCGGAFITIGTLTFTGYNPFTETPCGSTACIMFPWGTTTDETLNNLATAIDSSSDFTGIRVTNPDATQQINLTAKFSGPQYSGIVVSGDGRYGTGSTSGGGGYRFQSNALATPPYTVSQYAVSITTGPEALLFSFEFFGGGTAGYSLNLAADQCVMVANGYMFALWNPAGDAIGTEFSSILACAPWKPLGWDQTVFAAFVLGPRSWRNNAAPFTSGYGTTVSLDGVTVTVANNANQPRIMALWNPGVPLLTAAAQPLILGAYVMMGAGFSGTPGLVGMMADCAVVGANVGDGALLNGRPSRTLITQGGAGYTDLISVLMAIGGVA